MDGLVEIFGVTLVLRLEIRPLVDLKERKSCSLASIHHAVVCVCVHVCVYAFLLVLLCVRVV